MNYYKKELFLAEVDKQDTIIGKVERWDAHKKGVLHRGFTMILTYKGKIILQHRKHLAFDGYFDLTFSSHQIYVYNVLQTDEDAINETLKREWNTDQTGIKNIPKYLGKSYYKAKDPNSDFTEHEIDYIYIAELKNPPNPNSDFAYGFKLIEKKELLTTNYNLQSKHFAPWINEILKMII